LITIEANSTNGFLTIFQLMKELNKEAVICINGCGLRPIVPASPGGRASDTNVAVARARHLTKPSRHCSTEHSAQSTGHSSQSHRPLRQHMAPYHAGPLRLIGAAAGETFIPSHVSGSHLAHCTHSFVRRAPEFSPFSVASRPGIFTVPGRARPARERPCRCPGPTLACAHVICLAAPARPPALLIKHGI
jgi:hypothetical protein